MAYIRTCVQNLGEIRRPVRKTWLSSLIILDVRSLAIASRASQFPSGALSCRVKV